MGDAEALPPGRAYEQALARGRVLFARCETCREPAFPPRVLCPTCGSTDVAWRESEGTGSVYSETTVHRREGSHQVALVDLDEGIRVMTAGDDVAIGQRVRVVVDDGSLVARA
jgi:uncharacterized protein